eukprot:5966978-Prymnesium_polylepis.2
MARLRRHQPAARRLRQGARRLLVHRPEARQEQVRLASGCARAERTIPMHSYLDGYGKEQQWSSYELGPEGQEFGYLDYVNPVSWYRYYTAPALEEAQPEAPAPA